MLLRPLRILVYVLVAFGAGVLYERSAQADKCLDQGGHIVEGICYGDS